MAGGSGYTPSATAVAIAGDRVLAVGGEGEVGALAGPQTAVIDLGGRTVIPGLIDGHVHLMRAGQTWEDELHWEGVPTLAAALEMVSR
ncbi:MAG: amidohydrolase family protein, partial [Candidatus Dormibacteraeota bacterium]|nr:amidohydrolase family protein [Candidatus Dormibacteraeota bacterium]